jgi:hypothetical protein
MKMRAVYQNKTVQGARFRIPDAGFRIRDIAA